MQLRKVLQRNEQIEYRSADLFMEDVDDKIDITNMNVYPDESFDSFVCSHVLEHVDDDLKAMRELRRILKQDGWGIAMVPINLALEENYEDASITSESGRWKHFGQNDHVRMYSKPGFIGRLNEAGFKVEQYGVDFFGLETFEKHGVHPRSVLYVVKK
jgi:predicted SAM-dependent methyltransferase